MVTVVRVTLITLHRPLLYRTSEHDSGASNREKARVKSAVAAAAGMEVLRRMIDQDMIKYLPPER